MAPLRALYTVAVVIPVTFVLCMRSYLSRLWNPSGDGVVEIARIWSRVVTRLLGIRVHTTMRAPLPTGRPYVFMANHTSAADIWSLYVALPIPVRMIAKKSLVLIPFLGWAMRAGRFIFIDRANPTRARRSMEEAQRRMSGGVSVLLFPEGTRSRDGRLGPFKKGGFHLAMDAGVDIVPVAVKGAVDVLPKGKLIPRPGVVSVAIGTPIATRELGDNDRDALIEAVRAQIEGLLAGRAEAPSTAHARA